MQKSECVPKENSLKIIPLSSDQLKYVKVLFWGQDCDATHGYICITSARDEYPTSSFRLILVIRKDIFAWKTCYMIKTGGRFNADQKAGDQSVKKIKRENKVNILQEGQHLWREKFTSEDGDLSWEFF